MTEIMSAEGNAPRGARAERVVVLNNVSHARGGATGLALESVRLLRADGVAVTYFSADGGSNAEIAALGVEIVATGDDGVVGRAAGGPFSGLYNVRAVRALRDWIARNDTPRTVYHLHGWAQGLSPAIMGPLRKVAPRVAIHAHDYFLVCPNGAFHDYKRGEGCERRPLSAGCIATNCDKRHYAHKAWRLARQTVRLASFDLDKARVLLIHEGMAPAFERSGVSPAALHVVRNPIVRKRADRVAAEGNDRAIYIGRLQPEKGVEDALAAARMAGMALDVVGDGPLRASLEAAWPEARFLGWRNADEIGALLGAARVALMPSRYPEPFGMVCLEAAGAGVPVILPPNALLSADVARHGLGYVCDTTDIPAFAAKLAEARADSTYIEAASRRGFDMLRELSPTPEGWRDRLRAIYDDMVAAGLPRDAV